ncbi:MAG: hypothetical protein DDT41_01771 [candidate division WS2 bacterium]|nr:hypothetical protein [Candidatus Psychracetigena formicireducens]
MVMIIFNKLKYFCCWIGWHSYFIGFENIHHSIKDPLKFLLFAKCKWCGYTGQIDCQGNLF